MMASCLNCGKLFDQKPVNYRLPNSESNKHNYGECDQCLLGFAGHMKKIEIRLPPKINFTQIEFERIPEKEKKLMRDFCYKYFFDKDSKIKTKNEFYKFVRSELQLRYGKGAIARVVSRDAMQKAGYDVTFFRKRNEKIETKN